MSEIGIIILSDSLTLILSLSSVLFAAGMKWAEVKHDIEAIKENIAKIEGMFVVRIRADRIDRE